ncbi:helix-turn-helix transcriptional regulator [Paenibacillus sp. strain BS8-2]
MDKEQMLRQLHIQIHWVIDKEASPGWRDIRQNRSAHTFYWIKEGRGRFRGKEDYDVRAGMLFYLRPGLPLSMETDDRYPLRITMVLVSAFHADRDDNSWRRLDEALPLPFRLVTEGNTASEFDMLFRNIEECWVPGQADGELMTKSLIYRLMGMFHRHARLEVAGSPQTADTFARAKQALDRGYMREIRLSELAAECGISESHMRHLFHQQLRVSPKAYLNGLRGEHAKKQLLYTDHTMKEIAESCGYADEFHFSKSFKKQFGTPPKDWRSTMKGRI